MTEASHAAARFGWILGVSILGTAWIVGIGMALNAIYLGRTAGVQLLGMVALALGIAMAATVVLP